ncbi:MAG: cytochrome b [Pseudomonadota bacterium]
MALRDTGKRFGSVSIVNHWTVAVVIIALLAIGLYMDTLPRGAELTWWINLHKSLGVFVLIYGFWRVLWRVVWRFPDDVAVMPRWQEVAAKAVHIALLLCILGMPISGYIMSSTGGHPVSFFSLFSLPALPESGSVNKIAGGVHEWLAYALIAIIVVHVAAAVKHHVVDKDATLKRMVGRMT